MPARCLLIILLLVVAAPLRAAEFEAVADVAERFARLQTQGLPGKVSVSVGKLDISRLPACSALEAFSPAGARPSGKTHVGVRCLGPSVWSVLVPVQIAVTGSYVTTARPLVAGQVLQADDLVTRSGDLSQQPGSVVTEARQAIGKTLRNSLGSGQPLRADQLLAPLVIRQGQTVRVVSSGTAFSVSAEGTALNNAAEGQLAQVRMNSGQTISGKATAEGNVEVSF